MRLEQGMDKLNETTIPYSLGKLVDFAKQQFAYNFDDFYGKNRPITVCYDYDEVSYELTVKKRRNNMENNMIECDIQKLKEMISKNTDKNGKCFVHFIGKNEQGEKTMLTINFNNKE